MSRKDLTFRHNLDKGRHSWLRLTPAYSAKLVNQILDQVNAKYVLDPFSGTGTTGLACRERSINCDLIEINPFLVWLARVKMRNYTKSELSETDKIANHIIDQVIQMTNREEIWTPPIYNIKRWWNEERLMVLAQINHQINRVSEEKSHSDELDLIRVAFCRSTITWSNAAFNHQSMSFKNKHSSSSYQEKRLILESFHKTVKFIIETCKDNLSGNVNVFEGDSRNVVNITKGPYDCIITSPPYTNRISYVRELRPYMFWLRYLKNGREASELDCKAIGGTWGLATSRLGTWVPPKEIDIDFNGLPAIVESICKKSNILANYVYKYFIDIAEHFDSITQVLASNSKVFYVIGNSRFYNVLVPVEKIYASMMKQYGFENTKVKILRKRSSKKELFEYLVSGIYIP